MRLFETIYRRLINDTALNNEVAQRVYANEAVDETKPYIVLDIQKLGDDWTSKRDHDEFEVVITTHGATSASRDDIGDMIEELLNRTTWEDGNVSVLSSYMDSRDTTNSTLQGMVETMIFEDQQRYEMKASM
jgi:hypothetical protein